MPSLQLLVWLICVLPLLLLVANQSRVAAENGTIYIFTTDQEVESRCPSQPCYTLRKLVDASNVHTFTSNTTIAMSPGIHIAGSNTSNQLLIENVHTFTISCFEFGNGSYYLLPTNQKATIQCIGPFGFTFRNVTGLKISGASFEGCGCPKSSYSDTDVTLFVSNSSSVTIENVFIHRSVGIGLLATNVHGELLLSHLNLTNNDVNCYILVNATSSTPTLILTASNFSLGNNTKGEIINPFERKITAGGLSIHSLKQGQVIVILTNIILDRNNRNLDLTGYFGSTIRIDALTSFGNIQFDNKHQSIQLSVNSKDTFLVLSNSIVVETAMGSVLISISQGSEALLRKMTIIGPIKVGLRGWIRLENINATNTSLKIYTVLGEKSHIFFRGQNMILYNHKRSVWLTKNNKLIFEEGSEMYFINNMLHDSYSILHAVESEIDVKRDAYIRFENNTSNSAYGGAITAVATTITIWGPNSALEFVRNTGTNGGAIAMYDHSQISILPGNLLRFVENSAILKGGAIYVEDSSYTVRLKFYKPFLKFHSIPPQIPCPKFEFTNNIAAVAGDTLYGGWIDLSGICHVSVINKSHTVTTQTMVSSNPARVCMCKDSTPDCRITHYSVDLHPGQTFEIKAVAVGQEFGIVPAVIYAQLNVTNIKMGFKRMQYVQNVNKYCTTLSYTLYSFLMNTTVKLTLIVEFSVPDEVKRLTHHSELLFEQLTITVNITNCPPGFAFDSTLRTCMCHPDLVRNKIECDMTAFKVMRSGEVWIQATSHNSGVIISKFCPYKYCFSSNIVPVVDLVRPDKQCAFNRTGILCGACQTNFSQMIGSSQCELGCSNLWTLLLIPVFALLGIALVIFLMLVNLTVSTGTLNGLIFYANVVRANHALFFPSEVSNSFLSWFIAWLNLDLGIEVCFYNGLDGYAKAWFQFLFPLYIWFIMIVLIVLSRRYVMVARLCGNNTVQVLATLFLLSYAKLLRNIITVFQSTTLVHSGGYHQTVWLYDGNVDYLKGKHIPLFIAALLVLIFLSIPYTAILLTIQWLQKANRCNRILFWVHKFKPLFDSYTGPYKENHRYWTGLLLLVRVILFLVFSLNTKNDPSINLLAINVTITAIVSYMAVFGWMYETKLPNFIEISFALNLACLSSGTFYQLNTSSGQIKVTHSLVVIAFISFIAIVLYHTFERLVDTRRGRQLKNSLCSKLKRKFTENVHAVFPQQHAKSVVSEVSHSSIELREALLGNEQEGISKKD